MTLAYHCVDIPIELPADDILTLDAYLGRGLQPNETQLPADGSSQGVEFHVFASSR